jgi:hypothetical protein
MAAARPSATRVPLLRMPCGRFVVRSLLHRGARALALAREAWQCQVCQQCTVGRAGPYALRALARARHRLARIARERTQPTAAQDAQPAAPRPRTRTDELGGEEE